MAVHPHELAGLGAGWVSRGHRALELLENRALKLLHVVPGCGVHVQEPLVHGVDRLVAIALARLGSVALLVVAHRVPALKLGQHGAHEGDRLVEGHARVFGQAGRAVLDHGLHGGLVGVTPLVVAPFAVMVGLVAPGVGPAILRREVHPAALAVVLGHLEQVGERLAGHGGDELEHVDARRDLAALPAAHGLTGDVELGGEFFLGEVVRASQRNELLGECHDGSFRPGVFAALSMRVVARHAKQPFVARSSAPALSGLSAEKTGAHEVPVCCCTALSRSPSTPLCG